LVEASECATPPHWTAIDARQFHRKFQKFLRQRHSIPVPATRPSRTTTTTTASLFSREKRQRNLQGGQFSHFEWRTTRDIAAMNFKQTEWVGNRQRAALLPPGGTTGQEATTLAVILTATTSFDPATWRGKTRMPEGARADTPGLRSHHPT